MNDQAIKQGGSAEPSVYEIRVAGRLDGGAWSECCDGMTATVDEENGETVLRGPLADQAALYGLLSRLHTLGLLLLSVDLE